MLTLLKAGLVGSVLGVGMFAVTLGGATFTIKQAGTVGVKVQQPEGPNFNVKIPSPLLTLGVAAIPLDLPEEAIAELEPVWPTIRKVTRELRELPDFTLVEVNDGTDHVRIHKVGSTMHVDVDSDDGVVQVSLPVGAFDQIARRIDRQMN